MNNNFIPVKTLPDKSLDLRRALISNDLEGQEKIIQQYINKECFVRIDTALIVYSSSDQTMFEKKIRYLEVFKTQFDKDSIMSAFVSSASRSSCIAIALHLWNTPLVQNFTDQQKQFLLKQSIGKESYYYALNKTKHLNNFQATLSFLIKDLGLTFNNALKREVYNHSKLNESELVSIAQPILLSIELEKNLYRPRESLSKTNVLLKGKI